MDLYQLLGTTFWQINLPAPQNWAFLRNNIVVQKTLKNDETPQAISSFYLKLL